MLFLDGYEHWKSLTNKRTGEFLAAGTIRDRFGGLNIIKKVLGLDETPPALERSFKAATTCKRELPRDIGIESIPLGELLSFVEHIHVKTLEASQNTDLEMREFFGFAKVLQSIRSELLDNTSKLTEINKPIKRDTKNLKEVEDDPTYSNEQRQLYRDRMDYLDTEKKQARSKILSRNRKDLQTQVVKIKPTIEKVLDKDTPLPKTSRTLFREQIVLTITTLTTISTGTATIVISAIGDFGGGGGVGSSASPPKDD